MRTKWNVPENKLNLNDATPYLDAYEMSRRNDVKVPNEISEEAQNLVPRFFKLTFYDGIYGDPQVAKLTATTFLNYLIDNFRGKVAAHRGDAGVSEFHKNIKHIYFSAHDTTLAGFITAIEQHVNQTHYPPLASLHLLELYKKGDKYYMNWNADGEFFNINNI